MTQLGPEDPHQNAAAPINVTQLLARHESLVKSLWGVGVTFVAAVAGVVTFVVTTRATLASHAESIKSLEEKASRSSPQAPIPAVSIQANPQASAQGGGVVITQPPPPPLPPPPSTDSELEAKLSQLQKSFKGVIAAFPSDCPDGWRAADGLGNRPDLRGRFLIGAGVVSGGDNIKPRSSGGSSRHRTGIRQNQNGGERGDGSTDQVTVEWEGEPGAMTPPANSDDMSWVYSPWMTHLPPYVAVVWCIKA